MANPDPLSVPFAIVKQCLTKYTDLRVLRHCLGLDPITTKPCQNIEIAGWRTVADELLQQLIVVCIDTEHWTLNSDEMTEIGLAVLRTHDVLPIARARNFGDHGFNLMEQAKFHFFRLREKAHLDTVNERSRGPEGNSFGEVRFVTFAEARDILRDLMVKPIDNVNGLRGYNHPIIILGQSIGHDRQHFNGKDLGFDLDALGTVVRYIDTQQIAVDAKFWFSPKGNPIGLRDLVKKLEFEHTNSHTAANDAARTLVAGILMAIPREARYDCRRNTQKVVYDLEASSRANFESLGGVAEYCCECGETGHTCGPGFSSEPRCARNHPIRCEECVSRGLDQWATTHIALHCNIVTDEVSKERLTWYADQPKEWKPKHPFSSRDRLQTFAPNAPQVIPPSDEEVAARRKWYDDQKGSPNATEPFVWEGRRFENSLLSGLGPPFPQNSSKSGRRGGTPYWPQDTAPSGYTLPLRPAGLPPFPPQGTQYNGPPPGFPRLMNPSQGSPGGALTNPPGPPGVGRGAWRNGLLSGPPPGLNRLPPPPPPRPGRPFPSSSGSGWGGSSTSSTGSGQSWRSSNQHQTNGFGRGRGRGGSQ
jgi:hypothetical protein